MKAGLGMLEWHVTTLGAVKENAKKKKNNKKKEKENRGQLNTHVLTRCGHRLPQQSKTYFACQLR
jgi:hypothetical protein